MGAAAGPQVVTTPLDAEARPTWLGKVEAGKDVEAAAGGAVIAVLVGAYLWYEGFGPTYMVIFALVAAGLSLKSRPEVVRAAAVAGTIFQGLSCLFLVVALFHGKLMGILSNIVAIFLLILFAFATEYFFFRAAIARLK